MGSEEKKKRKASHSAGVRTSWERQTGARRDEGQRTKDRAREERIEAYVNDDDLILEQCFDPEVLEVLLRYRREDGRRRVLFRGLRS